MINTDRWAGLKFSPFSSVACHQCHSSQIFATPFQDPPARRSSRLAITSTIRNISVFSKRLSSILQMCLNNWTFNCIALLLHSLLWFTISFVPPFYFSCSSDTQISKEIVGEC